MCRSAYGDKDNLAYEAVDVPVLFHRPERLVRYRLLAAGALCAGNVDVARLAVGETLPLVEALAASASIIWHGNMSEIIIIGKVTLLLRYLFLSQLPPAFVADKVVGMPGLP